MNPLLAQFIPEARDLLDRASSGVLALEREPGAGAVINDVFRAVHTLKGTSGLFKITPLIRLAHAAEDLLDEVRSRELDLNSEMVDNLLTSLDLIGQWIRRTRRGQRLPDDAEGEVGTSALRYCAPGWRRSSRPANAGAPGAFNSRHPVDGFPSLSEADRITALKAAARPARSPPGIRMRKKTVLPWRRPSAPCVPAQGAACGVRTTEPRPSGRSILLDPLQCWLLLPRVISDASRRVIEEHIVTSPIASRSSRSTPPTSSCRSARTPRRAGVPRFCRTCATSVRRRRSRGSFALVATLA